MHNPAYTLSERFGFILDGLCRAVAARIKGEALVAALPAALIVVIWTRIKRAETQVLALMARFQAGQLFRRRFMGRVAREVAAQASAGGGAARPRLPRQFGWLLPLVPVAAAGYGSQLRALLADPEMIALLAASAKARRILQPVCRMLGVEPELLLQGVADEVTVTKPRHETIIELEPKASREIPPRGAPPILACLTNNQSHPRPPWPTRHRRPNPLAKGKSFLVLFCKKEQRLKSEPKPEPAKGSPTRSEFSKAPSPARLRWGAEDRGCGGIAGRSARRRANNDGRGMGG